MAIYWLLGRFMAGSEVVPDVLPWLVVGCCCVAGIKCADSPRSVASWRIQFPTADSPGKLPCPAASGEREKRVYPNMIRMMPHMMPRRRRGFILRRLPASRLPVFLRFLLPGITTRRPVVFVVMVDWSA